MTTYVLNSAVITGPGTFRYRLISVDEAKELAAGPTVSTIGYQETADALSTILGRPIEVNRVQCRLEVGDTALVFRLIFPPGTNRTAPGSKGRLSQEFVLAHSELGLLERVE